MNRMKNIIKLEEAGMFLLSIYLFSQLGYTWWLYLVFILTPDISIAGYMFNNKTGAICYNIVHHKGLAIIIYIAGSSLANPPLQFAGLILFGHSALDRMMGYGLKYYEGFKYTQLGVIGK
jgi:hypothetical protein